MNGEPPPPEAREKPEAREPHREQVSPAGCKRGRSRKFPTLSKLSENSAVSCRNRRELLPFFAYFSLDAGPRRRRNAKFHSFRIKFAEKAPDFKKSTGKGAFPVENSASNLIRVSKTAQNLETDGSLCRKSVEKRKKFLFSISEDGEI